jgi:hypothetical protein
MAASFETGEECPKKPGMIQYPVERRSAEDRVNPFRKLKMLQISVEERNTVAESGH